MVKVGTLSKGVTVKVEEYVFTPSSSMTVMVIGFSASINNGLIVNVPAKYVTYPVKGDVVTLTRVIPSGSEYVPLIEYRSVYPLRTL
jgi:hypothetical protein